MGEGIAVKQDEPGPIIYGPPRPPRIAKNANKNYIVAHIWKTVVFPPYYTYVCSVTALKCSFHLGLK